MGLKNLIAKWAIKGALALIKVGFNIMDKDNNGQISYEEFEMSAEELHILTSEVLSKVFDK